jgi:hypothetical protein
MTWLEQKDADILEARKAVLESMEGIDVYCDQVSSSEYAHGRHRLNTL